MATPSVQKYFTDTVAGLATGKINVQDLRKQAISVRKQIDDLEKDLGPEAKAALAPYSGILDHFIRESRASGGILARDSRQARRTCDQARRPKSPKAGINPPAQPGR